MLFHLRAFWGGLVIGLIAVLPVHSQFLPDTESGDAILREFDYIPAFSTFSYIGHTGIFGEWQGTDSTDPGDFYEYDLQGTTNTPYTDVFNGLTFSSSTVKQRTFREFTQTNFWVALVFQIDQVRYSGGYARSDNFLYSSPGQPLDPDIRHQILVQAQPWVGRVLRARWTPFTKDAANNIFRCDGFVEYVYEQAGVNGGGGLWRNFLEKYIISPSMYLSSKVFAVVAREHGVAPTLVVTAGGSPLVNNQAISFDSVTAVATDESTGSGIRKIALVGPTPSSVNVTDITLSTTAVFSSLAGGGYTLSAYDRAGNKTSMQFKVQTGTGPSSGENSRTATVPASQKSTDCFTAVTTDTIAGIDSISFSKDGGGYSESATFQCAAVAKFGPFCNLAAGSYMTRIRNCAGTEWTYASTVTAASNSIQICGVDPSSTKTCSSVVPVSAAQLMGTSSFTVITTGSPIAPADIGKYCLGIAASAFGTDKSAADCPGGGGFPSRSFEGPASWWAGTTTFRVWNANPGSTQTINIGLEIRVRLYDSNGNTESAGLNYILGGSPDYNADPGEGIDGTVAVSEVGQPYPTSDSSGVFKSSPTIKSVDIASETLTSSMWEAIRRRVLGLPTSPKRSSGSEIVFTSTFPFSFTFQDPAGGVQTATSTLKVYRWSGVDWDSTTVTGLTVSKDVGTGVIIASGAMNRTGLYAAMFDGQDSSAPNTAWSIQGSSLGFAGTNFVSTYSYLVVSSTDLAVNGFASGVATTFYRIDGLPGDAYSVYSTSLSFLPGTHWVDSYATDYAGNVSSVTRATITVTAGSVTKLSGDLQVDGNLLVGFLGSGAKAEVVARAEYDYALMVSSVDGRAMLAVDNANFASIGTAPASGRLTLAGVAGDTALALRSGNSTAAVTGAQLAFGYDGTGELRHRLYTQHGSAANLNKLVFALWTPASGSSTTLGGLPLLSLEGSTITPANALVQVMPGGVSDVADKELVVSSGGVMGGGDVLRWDRWVPSAAHLKKDIRRLGRAEEEKAWADIAALKPVEYRRKAWGPDAPLERGYVFEETPQSIRDGPGATSLDERLVNAELALKAAMRRIVELKARIKKVKEARR